MIPDSGNIVNSLQTHVIQKLLIPGIHRAGKHEILPYHNPVHVSIRCIQHHFLVQIPGHTRQEHVVRDSISPLGKNGYTIQLETERFSPLILLSN